MLVMSGWFNGLLSRTAFPGVDQISSNRSQPPTVMSGTAGERSIVNRTEPKELSLTQILIFTMYSTLYLYFWFFFLFLMVVGLVVECCCHLFVDPQLIFSMDNTRDFRCREHLLPEVKPFRRINNIYL